MTTAADPNAAEILVVDDDALSREMLVLMLQSAAVRVASAADGLQAVEQIRHREDRPFVAVFTDVQMPGMGGLELLEWINRHAPATATVIMTGNQERELLSASLRGGAVEFLDKPFDLRAILGATRRAREIHHRRTDQLAAARRLLDIADIHQRLSRVAPAGAGGLRADLAVATRFYAMDEAGGDLVQTIALDPDRVLLVLGDVSGHGLREAFLSSYFQGVIAGMAGRDATGRGIAEAFNRFLFEQWNADDPLAIATSLSVCFLELDLRARRVSILNCGSPGVLLADEGRVSVLACGGSPLGWFRELEPAEAVVPISAAGQIILWSDGLEAHATRLDVPPLALAARILLAPPHSLADGFLKGADDDIVVCRAAWDAPGAEHPLAGQLVHHATFAGDSAARIDEFQAGWSRQLALILPGLPETELHDVTLCLREALLNAFVHGCAGDPARTAGVAILIDPARQLLVLQVTDDGPGFDPAAPAPGTDPEHISLGLRLIRSLAREVRHSPDGRRVDMTFRLPGAPAA